MKYRMTENAKETRQTVNESIIHDLKNGINDTVFEYNLQTMKGIMYNPISQTPLNDKKVLEILAQTPTDKTTDTRFVTFDQAKANGMHVKEGEKAVGTINFTIEQHKGEKGNENVLVGRTVKYFNAAQVVGIKEMGEPLGTYTSMEKIKLFNNLENRVIEAYKSQQDKYNKAMKNGEQVKEPTEFAPDRIQEIAGDGTRTDKITIITTYAMRNTAEFMGLNKDLDKEFLAGKNGEKGSLQEIQPQEREMRKEFREVLGASLLCREVGETSPFGAYLMYREGTAKQLGEIYEKNPEKLSHDIQSAVKAKNMVKEKVMFLTRSRKSKEEIKAMEEEFKNDPKNAGKTLSTTSYYTYKQIDVVKAEDRIQNDKSTKSIVETRAIETTKARYAKTLETQIKNMEMMEPNIMKVSKSLVDKIAESRKNLGLESDPKKFMKDYVELPMNRYTEDEKGNPKFEKKTFSFFSVDSKDIEKNYLNHEQIINKYANGKESDSVDIVSQVRADQQKKAEENAMKFIRNQAGKASRAKATTKAKEKQAWKKTQVEKAKTQTQTHKKSNNKSRKPTGISM